MLQTLGLMLVPLAAAARQGGTGTAPAAAPAQRASQPAARHPWESFQAILWLHGGPARDAAFFGRVRDAGFTAVSVDHDEDPELPGRHGLRAYLDHAAGKGDLHLREKDYEPVRQAYESRRDPAVLERPTLLHEPATRERLGADVQRRVARARAAHPLGVALDDEVSITRFDNPLDLCFHPSTLAAFRAFLRRKHSDLTSLNAAWDTSFPDWDRVRPMTADEVRAREFGAHGPPRNLSPWAEHREFMDDCLAQLVEHLCGVARAADPAARVGIEGGQPPAAYGGYDYARLLPACDFVEAYDIGGARELVQGLVRPDVRQFETIGPVASGDLTLITAARLWDLVAHGFGGAVVWSAGDVLTREGLTPFGRALGACLPHVTAPRTGLLVRGRRVWSPVWILESQASVRAWWMLDSRDDGPTWIKRLSSYEADHSTSQKTRRAWVRLLQDLGYQPRFAIADRLRQEQVTGAYRPAVIVLPALLALSDATARSLTAFVADGGLLLADLTPGWYTPDLVLRPRPVLDELFDVKRRGAPGAAVVDARVVPGAVRLPGGPAVLEPTLAAASTEALWQPCGEAAVQVERRRGAGRAVLLNLAVSEYTDVRLEEGSVVHARELRGRMRALLAVAGVAPLFEIEVKGAPACVERLVYETEAGLALVARINALELPALVTQLAARGAMPARVTLPRAGAARDLLTDASLGSGATIECPLDPVRGLFLLLPRE